MKRILLLISLFAISATAQVGVGTTTPQGALDISSSTNGVLVPRVILTSKTASSPITNPQGGAILDGTLVWNTATVGTSPNFSLSPGFYYWESGSWNSLAGSGGKEWSLTGNTGTTSTTNFIGTTDSQSLTIRTSNTNRFTIPNANQVHAMSAGDASLPFYSFSNDTDTGVFSPGDDFLGFSTRGVERFRISNGNQVHAMSLGSQTLPFYSFGADSNTGIYSPSTDALGLSTNGVERFRIPNTNQVHAMSLGTQTLPFYSFATDADTGIWSPGADILGFSTSGAERMRILPNGRVVINNTTPPVGDIFSVYTDATKNYSISGYNTQTSGSAIYGVNSSTTNNFSAIEGSTNSGNGAGVFGISNGTTTNGLTPSGVMGQYSGTSTSGVRIGVRGISNNGSGNQQIGVLGSYNGTGFGIGVYGIGFGGTIISGNEDIAIVGWRANNTNYSGYFNGNHVIANGTKSASVGTSKGNQLLYVTESPEVWFEDIGRAKLINGTVTVKLDPLFLETVFIDDEHQISVFLQEEGDSNGLYVIPQLDGFIVKEKNEGTSNINFSYRIMAKRLHFQDHRFGNDPIWGDGDTRKYNSYATPPPVDHNENKQFQEKQKREYKPSLYPEGFVPYEKINGTMHSKKEIKE